VVAGSPIVATIEASDTSLLDDRARAEAEARLKAAEAQCEQASILVERARDASDVALSELHRAEALFAKGTLTSESYDAVRLKHRLAAHDLRAAEFHQTIAAFERDQAKAAFVRFAERPLEMQPLYRHEICAPISGRVFRVFEENASPVTTGDRLIELGDPTDLEVEIDVLSSDAVRIKPGARVRFEHWGGEEALEGRVRLVEPSAFTKISALGIEEQRVWVIADIVTPPADRPTLGDGFRVEASIVVWESDDVLRIPSGALFRHQDAWAVYQVRNGRARRQRVVPGHDDGRMTEIREGLSPGDQVILHPSDRVADGVRIVSR
jgi:HlyD family secretion protein